MQSVAGLAAKAVNSGRNDELVWIKTGNADLEEWLSRLLVAHPKVRQSDELDSWELVDRYVKKGIIKGYILYRLDTSRVKGNAVRRGTDCSVNVATSLAGLLDGIIVDEGLQDLARAHGLRLLLDARDKSQEWCFQTYKDRFNRRMLCFQDPCKPNVRDLAIAHQVFTMFGQNEPASHAMSWLEPLSPILGWNSGDEFVTTDLSTRWGQIQTATDWCMNLPVLMAGSGQPAQSWTNQFDPSMIRWSDQRSAVCFVDTDGDNVQWLQGNFFRNSNYWADPDRGKIPFGWSCCFAQLAQLCPQAIDHALATRSANDWFIEWGGGYYYPDHFASERTNRWQLLAAHARRTWVLMQQTGNRIIGFNFIRVDSPDARKACEVFAGQTDGLLGILAYQYYPYEGGAGEVFWVKDRAGLDVPVITARYSIWENSNRRARSGTPAKIAREIRQTQDQSTARDLPRYDWVIAHAWSYFKKAPGSDENAENMPQENAPNCGGSRGYTPVLWCSDRLPTEIRVVSPDELIWRIRMRHNATQTRELLRKLAR